MDWTMVGAIGEILGAAAVVLSLLYLAASVRSSARQSRDLAARSVLHQISGVIDILARDPAAVSLWRRGHQGLLGLNDDERLQLSGVFLKFMRPYEELYYYRRDNAVDEWAWESVLALVRQPMGTPGFAEWWGVRREWFSAEFRDYVDGTLATLPENLSLADQYRLTVDQVENTPDSTA